MDDLEPVLDGSTGMVDPLEESAPRRCVVCGRLVGDRRQRTCPGECRRTWRAERQKWRRRRRRGEA